jgi:hypothetical protein
MPPPHLDKKKSMAFRPDLVFFPGKALRGRAHIGVIIGRRFEKVRNGHRFENLKKGHRSEVQMSVT